MDHFDSCEYECHSTSEQRNEMVVVLRWRMNETATSYHLDFNILHKIIYIYSDYGIKLCGPLWLLRISVSLNLWTMQSDGCCFKMKNEWNCNIWSSKFYQLAKNNLYLVRFWLNIGDKNLLGLVIMNIWWMVMFWDN